MANSKKRSKSCSRCKLEKSTDEFGRDTRAKDGLRSSCRKCTQIQNRSKACTLPIPATKLCTKCNLEKQNSEFNVNRHQKDGLHRYCRVCSYKRSQPYQIKYRYGLPEEEYLAMVAKNDGRCWICDRPPAGRALNVDHCHNTDRVRGILCWPCNRFLGHIKDDPTVLRKAIEYLA